VSSFSLPLLLSAKLLHSCPHSSETRKPIQAHFAQLAEITHLQKQFETRLFFYVDYFQIRPPIHGRLINRYIFDTTMRTHNESLIIIPGRHTK
jgi:hypothetical protein